MRLLSTTSMLICFFSISTISNATQMPLANFLNQVEEKNEAVSASQLTIQSTKDRANESKLIFRPNIYAQAQTAADKKPTANISSQGDRTDNSFILAGIQQQFNFGLQAKLEYNIAHTKIYDASKTFLPINDFHDGVAKLELSQSFWRNFLGRESISQESIISSQGKANEYAETYKIKAILAQAESIYWSLSQMRKVAKVQTESLERAAKIRTWNQNRLKNGLAESADFLQSDANYKARDYELKSTTQDVKALQRTFNSLRGIDSDLITEDLESVDSTKLKTLTLPTKDDLREDTKAALELQKISKASANMAIEKNKPTLEMYATYALNGRDPQTDQAITNSFKTNHDTKAIGVRFLTPLDFGTTTNNIDGYKKDQIAAEQNYNRKLFEQNQQWSDLVAKFEDAKTKLSLVEKIEEAQKVKAANERDRLNKGRTVTFQVLNFEQDYAQSELARIQNETNILNIYAQLKTFSAGGIK